MPELNMYTVRPNDGGLTRFVTRGIEDILPVPEFESPSRPPTEAEWDDVSDFFQTSEPPLSVEKPPTTDICKTQNTSSLRSPLYIDASNLSPRSHTPVGEMVTPSGPVASFSGFLSNSPASFTLSPTMSHSDSSEVGFRRPTDEVQLPYLPFSTSHSPSTPHSAPILYQTGSIGHCCDCGEAFDPIFTTSTRACTQLSPYPPQLNEEECGSPRFSSSSLPVISTAIASAVDVVQQWIDTRASSAATAANSALTNQDVFLNSLHETVKLLLILATNDGRLIERDTTKTIRPSMQIPPSPASPTKPMDALTAALLAPPVCCDSRPFDARFSDCFDPSFGDCTDSPDRCAHLQPGLSASTKESDHIGLNNITHTAQLLALPNVDTMAGATNFPIHRQYPIENPRVKHQSSNASSNSVSSIICQVPMIIQALQRLCTCQGVSLNERVSDLLEKLRHILSALAENTAVNQTMTAVTVSSAPTFASVGTQSDQLASQCDFQTSGELDGGLPPFRRCSTGTSLPSGHSELIDPRLKKTESRMRGSFRASTGTAPSQLFVKQVIKKSNPGKRTSASFPLDHPIQIPQPGDHTSTMETVGFPDSTVSSSLKQVSCDSHISSGGPTRRKQRALSESSNSHHHLFLDPTQQAHSFPLKSDVKKCRKVYGIENRSQWCNQCRWKKACRRFPDVAVKRSVNPVTAGCTTTITTSVSSNICSTIASLPSSELNRLSTPSSILELQDRPVPATTSHS